MDDETFREILDRCTKTPGFWLSRPPASYNTFQLCAQAIQDRLALANELQRLKDLSCNPSQ